MAWKNSAIGIAIAAALTIVSSHAAEQPQAGAPPHAMQHGQGRSPHAMPQPVTAPDGTTIKPLQTPTDYYAIQLRQPPPLPPAPPPGSPPQVIGQYHAARAAAMYGRDQWEEVSGQRTVRNVSRPTVTPVLPSPDHATGAAVILVPEGDFLHLEIDSAGYKLARQLADRGIAAMVLKYRTEDTPVDSLQAHDAQLARSKQLKSDPQTVLPGMKLLAEDLQDALRVARQRAKEMGVDPQRIGVLGFTSNASTVVANALSADRPAFVAAIDAVPTVSELPANVPPLFVATSDDSKAKKAANALARSWADAKSNADAHTYTSKQRKESCYWCADFMSWLKARDLLQPAKPAT